MKSYVRDCEIRSFYSCRDNRCESRAIISRDIQRHSASLIFGIERCWFLETSGIAVPQFRHAECAPAGSAAAAERFIILLVPYRSFIAGRATARRITLSVMQQRSIDRQVLPLRPPSVLVRFC
jgi:hypothetical protein